VPEVTFFVSDGQETTLHRAGCRRFDAGGRMGAGDRGF
jgi:hypothetical protein